ncbi:MAG: hypothetical protein A2018_07530 [Alphaproteobacteria bacterium GWF2_58_20]|nr:MAG: hypothetical protein A2018_07530 [Alphaproteobacteria bacterium GWF2_58_20]
MANASPQGFRVRRCIADNCNSGNSTGSGSSSTSDFNFTAVQGNPAAMNISDGSSPGETVILSVRNNSTTASGPITVVMTGNTSHFSKIADTCHGQPLPGQGSCSISLQPVAYVDGSYTATLMVAATPGGTKGITLAGTATGFATPPAGTAMPDDTIYVGITPDDALPLYTTRCDAGMSWDGTSCTGTRLGLAWNNAGNIWIKTGISNTKTGQANTEALVALSDSASPYMAAHYCANLAAGDAGAHGHDDWYLPARYELAVVYNSSAAAGGAFRSSFDTSGVWNAGYYWTSSEYPYSNSNSIRIRMNDGTHGSSGLKSAGLSVRCVRKGPAASAAPSGYTIAFDDALIDATTQYDTAFTISGATVGADYEFFIEDTDPATPDVEGTGTIATTPQSITGIDVSSLEDGMLTLTVVLGSGGNWGDDAIDIATKETADPALLEMLIGKGDPMAMDIEEGFSPSAGITFTVTNNGGQDTGPLSVNISGDTDHFEINSDDCSGNSLSAGMSCDILIQAVSTEDVSYSGTIEVTGTPGGTVSESLAGTASGFTLPMGSLVCWGRNSSGELGIGTSTNSPTPVTPIGMDAGLQNVSLGGNHACAVKTDGSLWCWGNNLFGAMGDGNQGTNQLTPANSSGLSSGVSKVFSGFFNTCALQNGALYCWGGSLNTPTAVAGMENGVTHVARSFSHTCAIKDTALYCWGTNSDGQLGDGTTTNSTTPVAVIGMGSSVTSVFTGNALTCALKSNGSVWCWGNNGSGRLGDGTTTSSAIPLEILNGGVAQLSSGAEHSCVIKTDGSLWCWGGNNFGQLGVGDNMAKFVPTPVPGMEAGNTRAVSASRNQHTCAIKTDGSLWCWGYNYAYQLGDGTTINQNVPMAVPNMDINVQEIHTGGDFTCAVQQ